MGKLWGIGAVTGWRAGGTRRVQREEAAGAVSVLEKRRF